jgi:hypothetical protein
MGKALGILVMGILLLVLALGCAMFTAWRAIPPPGGCDQCHTLPINANWAITYKPVALTDESGKLSFQTEQYTMQTTEKKGMSSLDLRKTQEQKCFECHKAPNQAHKDKAGRFHH